MKIFIILLLFSVVAQAQSAKQLCSQLVGDGSGKDAKARISLMKLTHNAAKSNGSSDRVEHEAILLSSLQKGPSFEVSTFLIQQLDICGGKASIPHMGKLLNHPQLGPNAARSITKLAKFSPSQSRELLLSAYKGGNANSKPYLLNAISVLKLNDSTVMGIYRSALKSKSEMVFALQGLAQAGEQQDSGIMLSAFSKATPPLRGKTFRLNLVYTEVLASKNKTTANKHLSVLKADLKKNEIPFLTGIASVGFKVNGVSDAWLDSLPKLNVHTQVGIIRILKASSFSGASAKLASLCKAHPSEAVYMQALAAVDAGKAAPFVLSNLKSKNKEVREVASKLATNYGSQFGTSLLSALIQKGEAGKEDIAMAKSMVSSKNVKEVVALWTNLNPSLSLAFIEVTGNIKDDGVATKMIEASKSDDKKIKKAALKALKDVVSAKNLNSLKSMLAKEESSTSVRYLQSATAVSIAQSDTTIIKALFSSLDKTRNDKLLVAFAKSNLKAALPLLKKDILSSSSDLQKETIKTLSSIAPELSSELLVLSIESSKDERNRILAARALAESATNSKESGKVRKAYLQRALKQKLPASEQKLLTGRLKKIK